MQSGQQVQLRAEAAVWIFALDQVVSSEQQARLLEELRRRLNDWNSHGALLRAELSFHDQRFLVCASEETQAEVSGCAKDSLRKTIEETCRAFDLSFAPHAAVFFRADDGRVESCSRAEFSRAALAADTPVFDTTVQTLEEFRRGFEKPLRESWHARLRTPKS